MKIGFFRKSKGIVSPVYVAIYHDGDTQLISTGQSISKDDWDASTAGPKNHNTDLYREITKIRDAVYKTYKTMSLKDDMVTALALKTEYGRRNIKDKATARDTDQKLKTQSSSLTALIERYKKEGLTEYRGSTAVEVGKSIDKFKEFLKRYPRLERRELTSGIIGHFSRYLQDDCKLADSTHGVKMTHLRWFLQWVGFKKAKIQKIKIRSTKPGERNKISLTAAELTMLENVDVSGSKEQQRAKDMFLLGCYLGLRISDLKRIVPYRVRNGSIDLTQGKNRTAVSIPIIPQADEILKRYKYSAPKIGISKINEQIKLVCKEAKIEQPTFWKAKRAGKLIETIYPKCELISSHSAIKTFISLAGERWGLRPEEIAAIVGKDVKTVLGYYLEPDIESAKIKILAAENRAQMKVV